MSNATISEPKKRGRRPSFTEKNQQDLLLGYLRSHMITYGPKQPEESAEVVLPLGGSTYRFRVQRFADFTFKVELDSTTAQLT